MKKWIIFLGCISWFIPTYSQIRYVNADQFPLIGKISDKTETRYERLPATLKDQCRPPLWKLGKNTSGLAIRFCSNSTTISAKWEVLDNTHMDHMTDVGCKGLDLYAWEDDHWQFVNSARPTGKVNEKQIIANMISKEREYLLFLPLYDGVVSLSIGVDSLATLKQPSLTYPKTDAPIIIYGTSITQGGCAARPGMSFSNILTRHLNQEVINLGFSGNGKLDYEIAETMDKRHDAALFILDFIPNVNEEQIKEKTATFVNLLRKENPNTPILFVESVIFPHALYDKSAFDIVTKKNKALKQEVEKLKQSGDKNIYYLSSDNLIGNDGEATVDGIHFTDLGFVRMAEKLQEKIFTILPVLLSHP
jgi:lysophospholipase L1-like esterase